MPASSSPVLIDTHCHLDFKDFNPDRIDVLEAARHAGVSVIINPGIDILSSQRIISLAQTHPQVYAAVGVHPNEVSSWNEEIHLALRELALQPKSIAIGEIGLDYYRDITPGNIQILAFVKQLELAADMGLPVIIHNRDASEDVMAVLKEWQAGLRNSGSPLADRPGVLHSFSGDETMVEKALQANFFIGISGPVTYRKAHNLQYLVRSLPLERILIETDSPFLTPQLHRGARNEPAYVRLIADKIADLHRQPVEEITKITTANARLLFKIGEKTLA